MKLVSFHAQGRDRVGLTLDEQRIFDLAAGAESLGRAADAPRTMIDLIEAGAEGLRLAQDVAKAAQAKPDSIASFAQDEITFHPPVRRPSAICCLALNNSANSERIIKGPKHPTYFLKTASSLVGHGGAIECKPHYGRVHPEPELAVVIGKRAKNVRREDSIEHVFGYTILNDITSPTMRGEDTYNYRAIHPKGGDVAEIEYVDTWVSYSGRYKGADTFGCLGPWLVTKDEVPDPHALDVSCHHQGRVITSDNTQNLFHKVPDVIAFITGYMTLLPGDIVAMGTALKRSAGGGAVQNVDLNKLGGPVSVSIERLGTLSNTVTWAD